MEAKIWEGGWGGVEDTSKGLIILIQPLPFLDAILKVSLLAIPLS